VRAKKPHNNHNAVVHEPAGTGSNRGEKHVATELELKLLIDAKDIPRLRRLPILQHASKSAKKQRLQTTYFDTPDLRLRQKGIALRVRRIDGKWIQTVKGGGQVAGGLHQRSEWEEEVSDCQPDFTKLPEEVSHLFPPALRKALGPVFATEFDRTAYLIAMPGNGLIELSLDRGVIRTGEQEAPISEVELELKAGDPADIFTLAGGLAHYLPLRLEDASKAERGYALHSHTPPTLIKAVQPALTEAMTVEQAYQTILWNCLGQLTGNRNGLLAETDPEYLHQMRVGLRRLRSAMRLFAPVIPRETLGALNDELRWLNAALGPARDWDVFTDETLVALRSHFPRHAGLTGLRHMANKIRAKHRRDVRAVVSLPRFDLLLLKLGAWIAGAKWRKHIKSEQRLALESPINDFAERRLNKHHKKFRTLGTNFAELSEEERHQVRIAAKRLRYAAEFFASLFSETKGREYAKALAAIQDVLGTLNDNATTRRLLRELSVKSTGLQQREAIGLIAGWSAHQTVEHLGHAAGAWARFVEQKLFWK
jgi:inorganic triphosphatase YgiF